MNDISVSKIVGSPNEFAWSQASSTGRLYIALSIFTDNASSEIIKIGKETLEQIQREFFALDEKKLSDIKIAVEKVFSSLRQDIQYSGVIASIHDDALYIITASEGFAYIDRNNNLAEIARGEVGKIIGFSGKILNDDIITIETGGFQKRISHKLLAEYTNLRNSEKIAENVAPFILEDSRGQEAAVIIHYQNSPKAHREQHDNYSTLPEAPSRKEPPAKRSKFSILLPQLSNFWKNKLSQISTKQKLIALIAIIVIAIFIGSLILERINEANKIKSQEFTALYEESSEKLAGAKSLISINRGRALEEATSAIQRIESNLTKFNNNSSQYEKLSSLLSELKSTQDTLSEGVDISGTVIFETNSSEILSKIDSLSITNNNIIIVEENGYIVLNENGKVQNEERTHIASVQDTTSNKDKLYVLTNNSVEQVTISNGRASQIIDNSRGATDIALFGSSIYLLENRGVVGKYSGSSFGRSNYFTDDVSPPQDAISFAIEGSIYIASKNTLKKFTRGVPDTDFKTEDTLNISQNSILYSQEGFNHLYILDKASGALAQLNTSGTVIKQYTTNIVSIQSFIINDSETKAFIATPSQVYSFDL